MASKRIPSTDRRKEIVETAAELFAKKGFNGVSTREIAKIAKVNEAILFRHFPTKKELYTEIINHKIEIKPEIFNLKAFEEGDDKEVFRTVAKFLINQTEKDSSILRIMLFSALEDHSLSSILFQKRTSVLFDFLTAYISKRISEGVFRNIEPRIAIRCFLGTLFHFIMVKELFTVPKSLRVTKEEAVRDYVDIFIDGMRK